MPSPRPTPDERLNELETRFTFLEEHVLALDRVLVEQGEAVDRLRRELAALSDRAGSPPEESPPSAP